MRPSRNRKSPGHPRLQQSTKDLTHFSLTRVPDQLITSHSAHSEAVLSTRISNRVSLKHYYGFLSESQIRSLTLSVGLQPHNRHSMPSPEMQDQTPILSQNHSTPSTTFDQSLARFSEHHVTGTSIALVRNLEGSGLPTPSPRQYTPPTHTRSKPRVHSIITIPNSNNPQAPPQEPQQLSLSVPSMLDAAIGSRHSPISKVDLISRELWRELEQELGEKIVFPLDDQTCQLSSTDSSPNHSPSKMFSTMTTPNSSSAESSPVSNPRPPISRLSVSKPSYCPPGNVPTVQRSAVNHSERARGIASEFRQALATPKPRRPLAPAPPELLNQLLSGSASPPPCLDTQVDSARMALRRQRVRNVPSTEPQRDSSASEMSIAAIFRPETDSPTDYEPKQVIKHVGAQLPNSSSFLSQMSSSSSSDAQFMPRRRYLSGESTESEVEVATPKEMLHSLPNSIKGSSAECCTPPLDSIQIADVDQIFMRPELLSSWASPACSPPQARPADSILPSPKPLRRAPLPSSKVPPTLQLASQRKTQGDDLSTALLSPQSTRSARREPPRVSHRAQPSITSTASNPDSQPTYIQPRAMTNRRTSEEAQRNSNPLPRRTTLVLRSTSDNRVPRAHSDPVPIPPRPRARHSHGVVPNPSRSLATSEKPSTRKRSASASVTKTRPSAPAVLPELPPIGSGMTLLTSRGNREMSSNLRPMSNSSVFERHETINPSFAFRNSQSCSTAISPPLPHSHCPVVPHRHSGQSMKPTPHPRSLRPRQSQPDLSGARGASRDVGLQITFPPPDLIRPPAPSPLNLTPSCSPPPSPDRFKFASRCTTETKKTTISTGLQVDRSLFVRVSKELFSRRPPLESISQDHKQRRSRSHSRPTKAILHLKTKSESLILAPEVPKSMFED